MSVSPSSGRPDLLQALAGRFPRRQRILNVLDGPEVWAFGEAVPDTPRHRGGAPRHYPGWLWIAFDFLVHEFGSAVEVVRELRDPHNWRMLQEAAKTQYPDDESTWLRDEPMALHHYNYAKKRYLKDPAYLDAIGEIHRRLSAQLTEDVGLCVPKEGMSWTHPELDNVVYGDGKVVTARTRKNRVDPKTGEVRPRCDPDIELYVTGGGEPAYGVGFVFLTARGAGPNHRVILDVIDAPRRGGEAAHAMAAFRRTLPLLPGSQIGLYDGAWRGVHRAEIYRLGKVPVSPPRGRDNPKPKERHYGPVAVRRTDGTDATIQLHLVDGLLIFRRSLKTVRCCSRPFQGSRRRGRNSSRGAATTSTGYPVSTVAGRFDCGCRLTRRTTRTDSIGRSTSLRSPLAIPTTTGSTAAATMPSQATTRSTTPCCVSGRTRSDGPASDSTSSPGRRTRTPRPGRCTPGGPVPRPIRQPERRGQLGEFTE